MQQRNNSRIGAIAAFSGAVSLLLGTVLHPASADPNDPLAAFTEYAADRAWIASHLLQLLGIGLMVAALVLLSQQLAQGPGANWAALGGVGAAASLAVAAVLQAVDGIALKGLVDSWAVASATDRDMLFRATLAVRQMEIGLASVFGLLMGLTAVLYGLALFSDRSFPNWLGGLAILGGLPIAVAGIVMAYTGFSDSAMTINLLASLLLLLWMIIVGGWLWRLASAQDPGAPGP